MSNRWLRCPDCDGPMVWPDTRGGWYSVVPPRPYCERNCGLAERLARLIPKRAPAIPVESGTAPKGTGGHVN